MIKQKAKDKKKTRNEELKYAIQRCLSTESILMFIGYLTSKRGLNGMRNTTAFQELYWQFQVCPFFFFLPFCEF